MLFPITCAPCLSRRYAPKNPVENGGSEEQYQIRFLGGKLGDALAKEYDVSTVGDLL